MKGRVQLLAILAIVLAFSFFFYLSIAQEIVNSSQNLATDENSSEQLASTSSNLEETNLQETVESQATIVSESERTFQESVETGGNESSVVQEEENQEIQINETTTTIEAPAKPKISLKLSVDKGRITRGESFLLKVIVLNEGETGAKNVKITVDLPRGFSTDASEKVCDVIEVNSSCEVEFSVNSNLSTQLGKNEIKVRATYE